MENVLSMDPETACRIFFFRILKDTVGSQDAGTSRLPRLNPSVRSLEVLEVLVWGPDRTQFFLFCLTFCCEKFPMSSMVFKSLICNVQ